MRAGLFLGSKKSGAFEHHVNAQLAPGQFGRIAIGEHAYAIAVHHQAVTVDHHAAIEATVHRIVARQVGIGLRVTQVVDGHDLHIVTSGRLVMSAQDVAADAAVAIDGDFDGHDK